jgi:hypothetical protein
MYQEKSFKGNNWLLKMKGPFGYSAKRPGTKARQVSLEQPLLYNPRLKHYTDGNAPLPYLILLIL